ncbi:MAG: hypothetical protein ACD_4C00463G0001 [uncultured bacterium (gcode 4)]|uniref:Uncharacterized protein n=1 Tax=uncultured bacterium (gcode 4) TaxID=1234023 RepID=K2G7I5_9BACT|nr:MAG: hypothetical protein ACD_4C00463G0001 [uncultured bacterium (gcode 4)]
MKDIFDIKDVIFLNFFDSKFFSYFSVVFAALFFLLIVFYVYRKFKEKLQLIEERELRKKKLKDEYINWIKRISKDDQEKIYKLNFLVRKYLEESKNISKSTKKTKNELKDFWDDNLNGFFEICEKAEFWKFSEFDFESMKKMWLNVIEKY